MNKKFNITNRFTKNGNRIIRNYLLGNHVISELSNGMKIRINSQQKYLNNLKTGGK